MDLTELLKRPEGKTLEFKRDLSSAAGVLRTVVAFANTAGGTTLALMETDPLPLIGSDPLSSRRRVWFAPFLLA